MYPLRNFAFLAVLAFLSLSTLATPQTARAQEIQFGKVIVKNNYDGWVTVRLYHADAVDRVFGSWTFRPNETAVLHVDGKEFTIGGDWLINVQFGNGVTSQRRLVYKVGTHADGAWTIYASDVQVGK